MNNLSHSNEWLFSLPKTIDTPHYVWYNTGIINRGEVIKMRKFKAWDKFYGHMVTPTGLELQDGKVIHIIEELPGETTKSPISDFELLQSTGLLDKNGKEIYEGDIVKHVSVPNPSMNNKHFEVIQTRSGEWRIDNYRDGRVLAYGSNMVEVVGNKFEHRGLLEEE